MRCKQVAPFLIALVLGVAGAVPANAWEKIGSRSVNKLIDKDVVAVHGRDRHKQIRLCVRRNIVHFKDLDVVFANGGHQDVQIRKFILPGSCTRAIDLKGNKRNIARIVVIYNTIGWTFKKATVDFFAR